MIQLICKMGMALWTLYMYMYIYIYAPIKGSVEDMAPHSIVRVDKVLGQLENIALMVWAAWRD